MRDHPNNRICETASVRHSGTNVGGKVSAFSGLLESRCRVLRLACLALLLFVMCGLCGCSQSVDRTPGVVENFPLFYYAVNKNATSMFRVEYEFRSNSTDGHIAELLQKLAESDAEENRYPVIPDKIHVEKWDISEEGELSIFFTGEYGELSYAREAVLKAGLVLTMTQIDTVCSVSFIVNGEPLMQRQEPVGPMTATMFANHIGEPTDVIEVRLYFVNSGNYGLAPISRLVFPDDYEMPEQYLLEYLISGPTASEVTSIEPVDQKPVAAIPAKTKILSISTKKSTCYVDFSSDFLESERTIPPMLILHSVADTLLHNFDYIDAVVITVEGKTLTTYRGEEVPAIFRSADVLAQ
ncbi:MAG: GerMN domain-containing protein [Lachnospiraceae bacterium]|nr:GerMN domain-containing protein [Lachnospiraceae bacterium]